MACLMVGVKSSSDKRAGIQNGYWGKFIDDVRATVLLYVLVHGVYSGARHPGKTAWDE